MTAASTAAAVWSARADDARANNRAETEKRKWRQAADADTRTATTNSREQLTVLIRWSPFEQQSMPAGDAREAWGETQ